MLDMEPRDPDPAVVGDPGISTLGEVLDPATARTYLGQALSDHGQTIEDIRFQILKHHPGKRCTLNISVRTPDGWRALIGKVYAEDRSDVYRAMHEISRVGFGPKEALGIPQPIAYVPALHLLLQENIDGPRAKEIFLTGDERERADASERSARWLAQFHAMAPRSGAVLRENYFQRAAQVGWMPTSVCANHHRAQGRPRGFLDKPWEPIRRRKR